MLIGAIILILILPMIIISVHDKPKHIYENSTAANSVPIEKHGVLLLQAKRTNNFKLLMALFFLLDMTSTIYNANIVPYYTDLGFNTEKLAAILFISSCAAFGGRFIIGAIFDNKESLHGMIFSCVTMLFGRIMISIVPIKEIFYIPGSICMNIGMGLASIATPILILNLFGNLDYSAILGRSTATSALGVDS